MRSNHGLNVPRSVLKRFLRLRTTRQYPHFDAKNKLEILAVKAGIKPAFSVTRGETSQLRLAATLLNLKYKLTTTPTPYFSREPKVKSSFLEAFIHIYQEEAAWIYSEARIESMISAALSGRLNEGYVLGYPECCIKWHEENRVLQVESIFQDVETYISENSSALINAQRGGGEKEIYEFLLCESTPPTYHEIEDRVFVDINDHIERTYRRYPFAPHWACSSCLDGQSKETERLNRQYQKLAMNINPKLAQMIVKSLGNLTNGK